VIERYTRPEMGALWTEQTKFEIWLEVELTFLDVLEERGDIPAGTAAAARQGARVDVARIDELEATLHHDVIAFLTSVTEKLGPEGRYLHRGMTSSDLLDTATGLRFKRSAGLVLAGVDRLIAVLRRLALEERDTLMIGRTHGVHAEPTTFGLKALVWYDEMRRQARRLRLAFRDVAVGKLSGAVGTYAHVEPAVEEALMARLGLTPAPVSTQVVQRDRHAWLMTTLAVAGGTLEKIATEIRGLQKTEVLELEEPFGKGQRGSSAMPHKRNPIVCERIAGLARVLRGNAQAAMENQALWHERDITHSSVERVIFPDSLILFDYMLAKLHQVLDGLTIHREHMLENLERTGGLIFSQRVLLALVDAGIPRDDAYRVVQRHAMATWRREGSFRDLLAADPLVQEHLGAVDLDELFDPSYFVRHTDLVMKRVLEEDTAREAVKQ
jgi:adenylosuccinate lyase